MVVMQVLSLCLISRLPLLCALEGLRLLSIPFEIFLITSEIWRGNMSLEC